MIDRERELARWVDAHRRRRPAPELRDRVAAALIAPTRSPTRWLTFAVGVASGLAATALLRCASMRLELARSDRDEAMDRVDATAELEQIATPSLVEPARPPVLPQIGPAVASPPAPPRALVPAQSTPAPVSREDEVALLRRAEARLRDEPQAALELLTRHAALHPTTTLAPEREALWILALCAVDRRIEGRGRKAAFLRDHPGSAYAKRIAAACDR